MAELDSELPLPKCCETAHHPWRFSAVPDREIFSRYALLFDIIAGKWRFAPLFEPNDVAHRRRLAAIAIVSATE